MVNNLSPEASGGYCYVCLNGMGGLVGWVVCTVIFVFSPTAVEFELGVLHFPFISFVPLVDAQAQVHGMHQANQTTTTFALLRSFLTPLSSFIIFQLFNFWLLLGGLGWWPRGTDWNNFFTS